MKTAIYIEDGLVQLVVTPESEWEKKALASFSDKPIEAKIFSGSFYDCRGGWVRQTYHGWLHEPHTIGYGRNDDESLILVARTAVVQPNAASSQEGK